MPRTLLCEEGASKVFHRLSTSDAKKKHLDQEW